MDFINSKKNREEDFDEIEFKKDHEERRKEVKKIQKKRDVDARKYKSSDGLTLSKINWGLFYVEQRQNLIIIRNAFFVFVSIMVWGGFVFVFGHYLLEGARSDSNLIKEVVASNLLSHNGFIEISAVPVSVGQPQHIRTGNKYDFFVVVKNKNKDFYAEFNYSFINNDEVVDIRKGYVLPNESKYLVLLGQKIVKPVGEVEFILGDISWKRIDKHKYDNFSKYLADHLDVEIKDKRFTDPRQSGLTEGNKLGVVSFEAVNHSSFNYVDLDLVIVSKYGSRIVDITKYRTGEFSSNERKNIDILMPQNIMYINSIEVYPEKFVFDRDGYVDFKVNEGIMKR